MPPSYLVYEDSTVYAQPAFRLMALVDLPLADPKARQAMAALLDVFLELASPELALFAHAGGKIKALKPETFSPKIVAKARKRIEEGDWPWPSTMRFYGHFEDPHPSVAPPHLRFEQLHEYGCIQIELPIDDRFLNPTLLTSVSDSFQAILGALPVLWAVVGYGMYQPVSIDSLIWMLPRVTPRYRCAIEVQPDKAHRLLRRTRHMDELREGTYPVLGLPDIGWRTFIGDEFLPRLPDLQALAAQPGVTLARGDSFTVVQAGAAPIWGDVNMAEDITPYRATARALKPCKPEWIRVRNGLFGGYENDNGLERIEQWYQRFDE